MTTNFSGDSSASIFLSDADDDDDRRCSGSRRADNRGGCASDDPAAQSNVLHLPVTVFPWSPLADGMSTFHLVQSSTDSAAAASPVAMTTDVNGGGPSLLQGMPLPHDDQVVLIVLYTLTTALSVIGNVLAIAVFTAGRRSRTDLRWFLANLAVADLTMAVFCMPFTFTMTMLGDWIFSAPMCPVVLFFQTVSVTVSVFTSVAVGVDRYWVVNFPLRSRITKSRSPVVIAAIWAGACTLSSVQLVIGRSSPYTLPDGRQVMDCTEVWPDPRDVWHRSYTFFLLTTTYLLPLGLLSLTYGSVSMKLWQRTAPGNADVARDSQQLKSKRKVIKMLVIVVVLFAVCWLPLHAFIILVDFHPELTDYKTLSQKRFFVGVYYCVHWLAMSNSFVNPIIYGFLNDCFRSDLKWFLRVCFPCCRFLPCCQFEHPSKSFERSFRCNIDGNSRRFRTGGAAVAAGATAPAPGLCAAVALTAYNNPSGGPPRRSSSGTSRSRYDPVAAGRTNGLQDVVPAPRRFFPSASGRLLVDSKAADGSVTSVAGAVQLAVYDNGLDGAKAIVVVGGTGTGSSSFGSSSQFD